MRRGNTHTHTLSFWHSNTHTHKHTAIYNQHHWLWSNFSPKVKKYVRVCRVGVWSGAGVRNVTLVGWIWHAKIWQPTRVFQTRMQRERKSEWQVWAFFSLLGSSLYLRKNVVLLQEHHYRCESKIAKWNLRDKLKFAGYFITDLNLINITEYSNIHDTYNLR